MKKLYIIAAGLLAMVTTSCGEDWLAVESHDKIYIEEYYNSEARIYEALVAAYDPMQWFDWDGEQYNGIPFVFDVMSDDVYPGGGSPSDNEHWHRMFDFSAEPTKVCSSLWSDCYSGINRANCVFQYMPNVADIDEETKTLYLNEAAVLRAFYYNILWKLWGNIPYYTTNLSAPYIHPQSTATEVYNQVIVTLEDVLENGVLPMRNEDPATQGRVTRAMAIMLYTEMVMYQNDDTRKQQALNYLEEIIGSGKYDLYNDVANLFEPAAEWCEESIFEINYFNVGAYRSWGNVKLAGGSVLPRILGINEMAGSSKYQNGWGFGTMRAEAAELYKDGDKRKASTVYQPAVDDPGASYTPRYQDTGYFVAKYLPRLDGNAEQIADADLNFGNNIRIYRYAETLLYAAELLAEGYTGQGSAADYLGRVRSRAGLSLDGSDLAAIKAERRLELMGEGKRYFDLVRWGDAATVLVPEEEGYRTNSWTEKKKYLPIPQSEIDAAQGTLVQNNY